MACCAIINEQLSCNSDPTKQHHPNQMLQPKAGGFSDRGRKGRKNCGSTFDRLTARVGGFIDLLGVATIIN
jgi:hypothetical protein